MGNGKSVKCPQCGEKLSSGKALGGHLSKHWSPKKRAAIQAKKGRQLEAKERRQEVAGRLTYDPKKSRWTADYAGRGKLGLRTPNLVAPKTINAMGKIVAVGSESGAAVAQNQIVAKMKEQAKGKRDFAAQLETKMTELREAANEIDRLAERLERIL
jgi:hypothetical protein